MLAYHLDPAPSYSLDEVSSQKFGVKWKIPPKKQVIAYSKAPTQSLSIRIRICLKGLIWAKSRKNRRGN